MSLIYKINNKIVKNLYILIYKLNQIKRFNLKNRRQSFFRESLLAVINYVITDFCNWMGIKDDKAFYSKITKEHIESVKKSSFP